MQLGPLVSSSDGLIHCPLESACEMSRPTGPCREIVAPFALAQLTLTLALIL
jgi:hypothetical protein